MAKRKAAGDPVRLDASSGMKGVTMASGLPDYYRGVDIAYQALAQMIVRPKYGGAKISEGYLDVTVDKYNLLLSISGKGMTYAGTVWLDYTLTQANAQVRLEIDGVMVTSLRFVELKLYGINNPKTAIVTLNAFDGENFIYSAGISSGITFETSLKLYYREANLTTPRVWYRLIYALI